MREATVQRSDKAAETLNRDWGTHLDGKQIDRWAGQWTELLWNGHAALVAVQIKKWSQQLGLPRKQDGRDHPRRIVGAKRGLF